MQINFCFFINDEMVEIIVATNQKINVHAAKIEYLRRKLFEPLNTIEIRDCILLLFGLLKKGDADVSKIW